MDTRIHKILLSQSYQQRNVMLALSVLLAVALVSMAGYTTWLLRHQHIVFLPSGSESELWVSRSSVSKQYLNEMTRYYTQLRLTTSAKTIQSQANELLRHCDYQFHQQLKKQLTVEINHITKSQVNTSFYPTKIVVDEQALTAKVEGEVQVNVAGAALPSRRTEYQLAFQLQDGKLLLKQFSEVGNHAH